MHHVLCWRCCKNVSWHASVLCVQCIKDAAKVIVARQEVSVEGVGGGVQKYTPPPEEQNETHPTTEVGQ